MRNLTQTRTNRISCSTILLTFIFGLFGQDSIAQCDSIHILKDGTKTILTGKYLGKYYNSSDKNWYNMYQFTTNLPHDVSHTNWQADSACQTKSTFLGGGLFTGNISSPSLYPLNNSWELGPDGSDKSLGKPYVIKLDSGFSKKTTINIYLKMDKDYVMTNNYVRIKAGNDWYQLKLCGSSLSCKIVPVKLAAFDVIHVGKDRKISWVTATEINNKQFEVERSLDGGKTWGKISTVKTKAEGGNSSQLLFYGMTDNQVLPTGKVPFYRLHQVDYDGTEWTSWAVKPKPIGWENKPFDVSVSPNPASDIVLINLETKELLFGNKLEIYDVLGKIVYQTVFDGKSIQLDMSNLPRGIYKIRLETGDFVKTKSIHLVDK